VEGYVAEERMERRQSDVPAAGSVATLFLEVSEEGADEGGVKILETQCRWRFFETLRCKRKEYAEGVAIACDCMRACLSLAHEAVSEGCVEQSGKSSVFIVRALSAPDAG
jgi:hypothetical protein